MADELSDPRFTRIMLRRDLVADGWTDRSIARMVAAGLWSKPRRGAYVERSDWRALDVAGRHVVRSRAVVLQANAEVVLSHTSGVCVFAGPTWGLDLSWVHVTRRDGRSGRSQAGVKQHRGLIKPTDVVTRDGIEVMAPTRLALEVTTVTTTDAALGVVNYLLHKAETTLEELQRRYDEGIDLWRDTLKTDLVLRLADPRIASLGESRTFYLCYRYGLPAPIPQFPIQDGSGHVVAVVDFAWPELGVFLEFDGKVKYAELLADGETASDVVVREKRREDLVRELTGWRCIRLVWADLDRPERTAQRIRNCLFPSALAS